MPIYLAVAEITVNLFDLMGLGLVVGIISGLFGVGGGFLLTPFLLIYGVSAPVAVGSVTAQVIASSTSGALSHLRRGSIDVKLGGFLVLGGAFGAVIGVLIFDWLRGLGQLDLLLAIGYLSLLGTIGTLMLVETVGAFLRNRSIGPKPRHVRPRHHGWAQTLPFRVKFRRSGMILSVIPVIGIGLLIGIVGAILGIGGGFILVPALVYLLRIPGKFVVGTSLLHLTAVMAVTCFLHAWRTQSVDIVLAFCLMIGGVLGAQIGSSLGQKLKGEQMRLLLALVVLGVALRFAWGLFVMPSDPFSSQRIDPGMIP